MKKIMMYVAVLFIMNLFGAEQPNSFPSKNAYMDLEIKDLSYIPGKPTQDITTLMVSLAEIDHSYNGRKVLVSIPYAPESFIGVQSSMVRVSHSIIQKSVEERRRIQDFYRAVIDHLRILNSGQYK